MYVVTVCSLTHRLLRLVE